MALAKPPLIDGVIDPAEWQGAATSKGFYDDETGAPAPEDTQFWIAYDKDYVYFAAKVFDSQPGSIRATEYRTNVSLSGDDSISLSLDLTGSMAEFNEFGMNARGATQIELSGGRAAKREWSGEFVAKGRIVSDGWEVEARIPWKIMRLPAAGPRTLRFNVSRELQRTQREYVWRYTGGGAVQNHGRWLSVEIPKAPVERTLLLLPYAYGGWDEDRGHVANAGVDLKTNLTDQVVAVGSINPDFRNIENEILSLDFSRFERIAGETRPFFQEGSQYLESALFASQRIPGFDMGLNVHGRLSDRMNFGVLDTIDFGLRNSLVANGTYNPTPTESYRATVTSLTAGGLENTAYLARYSKTLGPLSLFLRNMGTADSAQGGGVFNTLSMNYFRQGLNVFFSYDAVSPDFLPRLGFVPERNYRGVSTGIEWSKPLGKGLVKEMRPNVFWQDYDRFDGGNYRQSLFAGQSVLFKDNTGLDLFTQLEDFLGVYDRLYGVRLTRPRGNPYRQFTADYQWGRLALQSYKSLTLSAAYRPVEKLQLTASYQVVDHFEKSDLGILGLNYDMGNDTYLGGRLVKRDEDLNFYLSWRRSGNKGIEYYVILGDPNAQTFRTSLIFKVVAPLAIGG